MYTQITFIENLEIDETIEDFRLHKGKDIVDRLPKEFYLNYGENTRYQLNLKCVDFGNVTNSVIKKDMADGNDLNEYIHNNISSFYLFSTWLVRDMSIFSSRSLLFSLETNEFFENVRNVYLSKADGNYYVEKIFHQDLLSAIELLNKVSKIVGTYQKRTVEKGRFSFGYSNNTIDYSMTNRFERSINFIGNARSTNDVLEKISWYIVALEALYSDVKSSGALKQKLATRVPSFISCDIKEIFKLKNDILEGYSIRSSYLHGSGIKRSKSLHSLHVNISVSLDNMLRRSFITVVNDPEKRDVFVDSKKFEKYFKIKAL